MQRPATLGPVLVSILLLAASCVPTPTNRTIIPEGLYLTDDSVEQIYVDSESIYFITRNVRAERERPDSFTTIYVGYTVTEEGEILPTILPANLFHITLFEWRWIDGKIARIERAGVRSFEWDLVDGKIVPVERWSDVRTTWFIRREVGQAGVPQRNRPEKEVSK